MGTVKTFDCQRCLQDTDRDRFYYDPKMVRVRDRKTGWILSVHTYRFGKALQITDDTGLLLVKIYCYVKTSCLSILEKLKYKNENIAISIAWVVEWPAVYDEKPKMPEITRQYIINFFCFYKGSNGVGHYVEGIPKDAIVYVDIIAV